MKFKFSFIVGFRDRDIARVKTSLDSLSAQTNQDFELIFIDYGSAEPIQVQVKVLVESYQFSKYVFSDTRGWFWNRAHALNTGIKLASGEVLIISDIDLVFPLNFLESLKNLSFNKCFYTFNCYYLQAKVNYAQITTCDIINAEVNYVGLCAVQKKSILNEFFYREYYMDWGGEDYGFYMGLENAGYDRHHMSINDFPVFHQWHSRHSPKSLTPWYLAMVTYLYSGSAYDKTKDLKPGLLIDGTHRTILTQLNKADLFKNLELFPDPVFQFNVFLDEFYKMKSGKFGQFEYPIITPVILPKGRKQIVVEKFNKFFTKVKFPFKIESLKKVEPPIHNRDTWYDFVMYFIGENRYIIADYYILNTDQKLILYFQKK